MARDHSRWYLRAWGDPEWRALHPMSQWLYRLIVDHETLSYAGVADWRPNRLCRLASPVTADEIEIVAADLEERLYLLIDRDTEEVLVRSFVRNDRILYQPNVSQAMVKAWDGIASEALRGVLVHELRRLKKDQRDAKSWSDKFAGPMLARMLDAPDVDPTEALSLLPGNPSVNPSVNPSINPSGNPSTNPSAKAS